MVVVVVLFLVFCMCLMSCRVRVCSVVRLLVCLILRAKV